MEGLSPPEGDDTLLRRLEMERILVQISTRFVQPVDFDAALTESLQNIGHLTGADRVYLYLSSENGSWSYHTYEWCAEGVEPNRPNLRGLPSAEFPWWTRQLEQGTILCFDDMSQLPAEACSHAVSGDGSSGKSLLVFPIRANGRLWGCMGIDNSSISPAFQEQDVTLLRVLAQILAKALHQKNTEEALEQQGAFLRQVVDINPHFIFAKDRSGRYTLANKAMAALYGVTVTGLTGKTDADFNVRFDQAEAFRRTDLEVLDNQREMVIPEEQFTDANGRQHWLYTIKRPILHHGEHAEWVLGVATDITHLKEIEEALKRSESYFRGIFDNTSVGIAISHVSDNRFHDANPALQTMVGLQLADLRLLTWADLLTEGDFQILQEQKRHLARGTRKTFQGEFRLQRQDGSSTWCNVSGSLIRDAEKRPQYLVTTLEDIDQRKRAEADNEKLQAQFLQAQKMEALGRLTAGIAHDFNNLLTAINGFAELTRTRLSADDPLRDPVDKISRSGWHAADLVHQLLVFSRKETGQPQVVDLNNVVREIDVMLQRIIGEDIDLVTLLGTELWPVKVDPAQIEQVIVNLVVNARDAMPGGGQLTIETGNKFLDESYSRSHLNVIPGDYVVLAVSDTGVGMNADVQAHIFEPFYTTKGAGKGSGLGLSTVYGIVEQCHGHIWVYSEVGHGTTFKIYLPRTRSTLRPNGRVSSERAMPRGNETILLLEDNEGVRELTQWLLQDQGYTVISSTDSEEALRLHSQHQGPVHLLLSDVVIPGENGVSVAREMRATNPGLKVVFMSGYTDDAIQHLGVLDDDVAFIRKPFTPRDLAEKVRSVLDT